MTTTLATVTRDALSDAFDALVNGGANEGGLRLWSGTDADGTELGSFEFQDPAFDASGSSGGNAAGTMVLEGVPIASTADATGTVQSADIVQDLAGTPVQLLDIDEGAELTISNPSLASGQDLSLTAITYNTPAT